MYEKTRRNRMNIKKSTTRKWRRKYKMRIDNRKSVKIFTDGGCHPNTGTGGWGCLIQTEDQEIELYGGKKRTTNNQMELTAIIQGLKYFEEPCKIQVTTDSKYCKNGMQKWIQGWKRNGWKTMSGNPVKNQEYWMEMDLMCKIHQVTWRWVKGHDGHRENEIADELARKGRLEELENE